MPHGHRPGAHEAFPAGPQGQSLDRSADRVGPVQHPDRLPVFRRRLQHMTQGGDEGVDSTAEVLKVDQQDVEGLHHRVGRPPDLAIEAEHRDVVDRILEVRRLDHVVLLVAAQAVLRPEGRRDLDIGAARQGVQRMLQAFRDRGWMRQQGDPPTRKRGP